MSEREPGGGQDSAELSAWDQVELARHPGRPYSQDYIDRLIPDFVPLRGDRLAGDDPALVAGLGTWHDMTVMIFGQQKGRTRPERLARNYGMLHPEGYRKAMRLAGYAARFGFPIISLVDTPGAFPGAEAEARGIASAIGYAITGWFQVTVPVVAVIIGEGGSGGALGMAVADRVLMFENSIYSVAAPEAAASIVFRDNSRKIEVAEQLQITSADLMAMGVVEEVIEEPPGGAHTDFDDAARRLDAALERHLPPLLQLPPERLLRNRYERFRYIDSLVQAALDFGPKVG